MEISNALRVDTRDAIASLKALDAQADVTDEKLHRVGGSLDSAFSGRTNQNIGSLGDSFKRLDSGLLVTTRNIESTSTSAKGLGEDMDTLGTKTKKVGDDTKTATESMSKSWEQAGAKMKSDITAMGSLISDLATQRKAAANEVDKALLDQKLAVAKNQLRSLARDEAWSQLKKEGGEVGRVFADAAGAIGGGGGGGGGGFSSFGASMGGGGFLGGIKQVVTNIPMMAAAMVAALPAVLGLVGGLTALAGSLAAAGAGAGALGVGAVGALAVGGISTGIEAKMGISQVTNQQKLFDAWTKAVQQQGNQSTAALTAERNLKAGAKSSGVSLQQSADIYKFQQGFKQSLQPGTQAVQGALFAGVGDLNAARSPLSALMNRDTEAVATALEGAFKTLTDPQVMHSLDSLSQTFASIAGPGIGTGVNLLRTFLNLAVSSEPFVVRMFNSMDTWSSHLERSTSDTGRMTEKMAPLVQEFRDWGKLMEAGGRLLKDVFSAGAPQGGSMVLELTKQFNIWDVWLKDHPAEVHNFFDTAIKDLGILTHLLGIAVGLFTNLAQALSPAFQVLGGLTSMLGNSGVLGPLLSGGVGAFLLRGGAAGKLFSPLSYLLNPAAGVAGTAGVGAARLLGRGRGAATAAEGSISEESRLASLTSKLTGGAGDTAKIVEAGGLLSKIGGLGGLATGALTAVGKFAAPIALMQGVFGLITHTGSVADRVQGTLHDMTFGLVPGVGPTTAQIKADTSGRAKDFFGRIPIGMGGRPTTQGSSWLIDQFGFQQSRLAPTRIPDVSKSMLTGTPAWTNVGPSDTTKAQVSQWDKMLGPLLAPAVQSVIKNLGTQFKFYSEPAMFSQLRTWIGKLPPDAQVAGIKSMESLAQGLEKNGKLPKGSVGKLIQAIDSEWPGLTKQMEEAGLNSSKALSRTLLDDRSKKKIQNDIRDAVAPFESLSNLRDVKISSDNVYDVWHGVMGKLHTLMTTGPESQRKAAKAAYDQLVKDTDAVSTTVQHNFDTMTKNSGGFFGNLTKTIFTETNKEITTVNNMVSSVSAGMTNVVGQVNQALKAFGLGTIKAVFTVGHSVTSGILGLGPNTPQNPITNPGLNKATGGRLPGSPQGDHIPLFGRGGSLLGIADGGELVVNRHTEARIAAKYGVNLGAEVASETRPHFATGGRIPGFGLGGVALQVDQILARDGFTKVAIAGILGNAMQESSMNPNAAGGGLWQQISNFGQGTGGSVQAQTAKMVSQIGGIAAALNSASSPGAAAVIFEQGFERAGIPMMANRILYANQAMAGNLVGGSGNVGVGGSAPTIHKPKITGPQGALVDIASMAMTKATHAGQQLLNQKIGAMGGGGGRGGTGFSGPMPKGVVTDPDGKPVAAWIEPILNYARQHGWAGSVSSGWRSLAEQTAIYNSGVRPAAVPGTSNHEQTTYPGGAVDVTDAAQLSSILTHSPYASTLVWAGSKDPVHFSHPHDGGYAQGGRLPGFAGWYKQGGSFVANRPTVVGVGDGGEPEHITITPKSQMGGRAGVVIEQIVVYNNREGDIKDMILKELRQVEEAIKNGHTHNPAGMMQ